VAKVDSMHQIKMEMNRVRRLNSCGASHAVLMSHILISKNERTNNNIQKNIIDAIVFISTFNSIQQFTHCSTCTNYTVEKYES
jgi:recombinational DNA repair protein RecR